jgi:hypothetical protein
MRLKSYYNSWPAEDKVPNGTTTLVIKHENGKLGLPQDVVSELLTRMGAQHGDEVRIFRHSFDVSKEHNPRGGGFKLVLKS